MADPVTERNGAVEVVVWVVPGASRTGVAGRHGDAVRIRVSAPAERGRATRAAAVLLSEMIGAPVELLAGDTARRKRFRIVGGDAETVRRALGL